MLTDRSKASLTQLIDLLPFTWAETLLEKHGVKGRIDLEYEQYEHRSMLREVRSRLRDAAPQTVLSIADDLVRSKQLYRRKASEVGLYDVQFQDLDLCLRLDGYLIEDGQLLRVEPILEGDPVIEDDLTRELGQCGLPCAQAVIRSLEESAQSFRRSPPDFNATLTNARVALQTLATAISDTFDSTRTGGFDRTKWGKVVEHLRTAEFISREQEKGLAGVFAFVSPGAHIPVGLSEVESVRLGRSLVVSMCYFLVKHFNGLRSSQ